MAILVLRVPLVEGHQERLGEGGDDDLAFGIQTCEGLDDGVDEGHRASGSLLIGLEFDIGVDAAGVEEGDDFVEGGNPLAREPLVVPRAGVDALEVLTPQVVHAARCVGRPVEQGVVEDDGRPIAQQIDVGLDPPRSGVDSGAEGRHGVLGGGRWQTAVGDNRAFDARRTAVGARGGFPDPVASSGHARSPDRTPAPTSVTPGFDDHPGTGRSIPPHHPTATGSGTSVIP